jgi:hypothetical protein
VAVVSEADATSSTASKWGRSSGSWAATMTVRPASQGAMAGRSGPWWGIERRRGLIEQEDGSGAQQGPGQRHPLALARTEGEAVLSQWRVEARGQMGDELGRVRPPRLTRSSASSVASGAPRRRFSASVAVKRYGRWGTHEKWARHSATVNSDDGRPSIDMVPALGCTNPSSAASTDDLPDPEGPDEGDPRARRRVEARTRRARRGAVVVLDPQASTRRSIAPAEVAMVLGRRATGRGGVSRASTSSTRAAAAWPSVLAWNSAPARRRGMKISGATSSTAMAVCTPSSPHSRRRPSAMATNPTPNPAIRSMERAERKATRSVRMVATRTPSADSTTSRRPRARRGRRPARWAGPR